MITPILFFTSTLFLWNALYFFKVNSKIHRLSALVLFTASSVYLGMGILSFIEPGIGLRPLRYIDWIITVPIMLYQMVWLSDNSSWKSLPYPSITSLFMLACGYLGEVGSVDKLYAGIFGTFFAIFTFLPLLNQIDQRTNRIYFMTMVGWLFYPLVYFISDSITIISLYSVVDIVVKLGFAHYLYKKLA